MGYRSTGAAPDELIDNAIQADARAACRGRLLHSYFLTPLHRLAPDLAERFVTWQIEAQHIAPDPLEPGTGALFEPMQDRGAVIGSRRRRQPAR